MTCTNHQVKLLMKYKNRYSLTTAAAKAGMSVKTARKYIMTREFPENIKKQRCHRTRKDPFEAHWAEIETLLKKSPELQAKTLIHYLQERYPNTYSDSHIRTLQRRIKVFRALQGKDKPVIFLQDIQPGQSSQSDWTVMNLSLIHI